MATENNKKQLKRKFITLENKVNILNRINNGEKVSSISKSVNLSISTVTTIRKNEAKVRRSVAEGHLNNAKVGRVRDNNLVVMENAIMIWFEDCIKKGLPLSGEIIKQKAVRLYNYLKETQHSIENSNKSFVASGWLDRLKTRYNLHNIKFKGERASADTKAADNFKIQIQEIIEKRGYCEDQIFNADETALYWRKLPERTYTFMKERHAPGYKVSKERVTLLLCSNVAGNCLVKPALLHQSLRPRVMKNDDMSELPVCWYNNKNAWITGKI